MKRIVNRHKWFASFVLLFVCSVSFALIGSNILSPSVSQTYSDFDEGDKDSVTSITSKKGEVPISDSVKLPYKYSSKQDIPYENLETPSGLRMGSSPSLKTEIEYDPETGQYNVHEKMGVYENGTPYSLSQQEYDNYSSKKLKQDYWHQKRSNKANGSSNGLLKDVVGNVLGDNNPIDIKTQGSAELTFGGKYSRNYNPSLTTKQQRIFNFDFTNKIQMSITGKIGDKVSMKVKYDTESQFDFENQMKLTYTGDEDEIIKKIEAGNVTFPIENTLIKGSQSLMGFRADLQFGKLKVSSVLSKQRGEFSTINVDKGAQTQQFSIKCDNYENNKHFFIGHYFREHYESAFKTTPDITDGILIRKVEIWMTQTSAGKENARNILAITDLGGEENKTKDYDMPSNQTDRLYKKIKDIPHIRDIDQISSVMANRGYTAGEDFEKVELAVKLKETQYTVNNKLGYISLKSSIDPSKVLAIAYEYEYKGQIYQVGEFSSDGVEHPNALIVKLLKSSHLNPQYNNWDLMMKNVYSIGGYQISADDFKLDILYDDAKSGKSIGYFPEGTLKGKPLLSIMNLDVINSNKEAHPDGYFDFLDGFTVNAQSGLIIFPVLEPFGSHLENVIGDATISKKYIYPELYDSTQSSARQASEKNKFTLKGSYKSSYSSDISLNTTQVQEGSVTVTAGGKKLTEGTDYTVDYAMGRVKIINQSLIESKTPIKVSLESNPLFSMRSKTMIGTRWDYAFNDKFKVGATLLRLTEQPLTTKVGFEDFPINNTVWGLNATYSKDVPFITRMVDKIPLINTKAKSTIKASAEFAQLIPSTSKLINQAVEVDYFENSQQKISLREPSLWVLSAPPQGQSKLFPGGDLINDVRSGYNRAQLAWFDINNDYFYGYSKNVSEAIQSNVYSHPVYSKNLFNKSQETTVVRPLTVINLAYYPRERGPYNYDVKPNNISAGINPVNGSLNSPEKRWAGITREMTTTDFEEANVEYIQFWLMDPFYYDSLKQNKGGDLYFDLGLISEDVLHDSRKFAENGLKSDPTKYEYTKLARVPNYQVVEKGFDNNENRADQDVGFDGLNDNDESIFFNTFLEDAQQYGVNGTIITKLKEDPSKDDFSSYLNDRGITDIPIFERYRYYNGPDGNSPVGNNEGTGRLTPDVEDINQDNTLQENEAYYQYKISIKPEDLVIGKNYVVDKLEEKTELNNGKTVNIGWYQIKIPINSALKQQIGNISDFKSIQFMRMLLTNFKDSIYLRMAELALVRSTWRKYENTIYETGEYDLNDDPQVDLSSVNVEENTSRKPVNYVLPPGVVQTIDPMNTLLTQQNESSLQVKIEGLEDGNARAIYKMLNKDLRQFGTLNMFMHGEAIEGEEKQIKDGDITVFMRLGSDYTQNYYEYEVPLSLTEPGTYASGKTNNPDRYKVWPEDNNFAINLKNLVKIKESRDSLLENNKNADAYQIFTKKDGNNKVSIKGYPTIGDVKTIMIGVRNKKKSSTNLSDDGQKKSVIVWFDELRLSNFNEKGGWAADASTQITMADFAVVSLDGKIVKPGFGGIDEQIFARSQNEVDQFNVTSSVALHKFFPEKLGLQLPFYVGWSQMTSTPLYDPLSSDELLKAKLNNLSSDSAKKYKELSQDFESRVSYNFTNVRITKQRPKHLHPLHVNNFSLTYAFNKIHDRSVDYIYEDRYDHKLALMYNYTLKTVSIEPFKHIKSKNLTLLRDFNIGLLPSQYSFDNQLDRTYKESLRRNLSQYSDPSYKFDPVYSKTFNWSRIYNLKWNLTKNLKFDYSANNIARVDEPQGLIYHDDSHDAYMKTYNDSLRKSILSGGTTTDFSQKIDLTYKVPIDKIQFLNFINSNVKYSGSYAWTKGYVLSSSVSSLNAGNIIKNSNSQSFDGTASLSKLYNKSKYLKDVDKRFSGRGKAKPKTENVKYTKDGVTIQAYTPVVIKHGLKTIDVKLSVLDTKGKVVEGKTVVIDANKITFTAEKDYDQAQVVVTGKRDVKDPAWQLIVDGVVHTLIMVKSVSINASQSLGSYVPGYDKNTQYFGLQNPFQSNAKPGWGYVFGYVPSYDELESTILGKNWLIANDSLLNDKFTRTSSNQVHIKTTIEPLNNFKINLENNRTFSQNETRYLSNDLTTMATSKKTTNGSFSISTNALKTNTLFDAAESDKTYAQFKKNLLIVANRLAKKRGGTYEIDPVTKFPSYYKSSSQDVLIPAFLSAYTGQDPNKMYLDSYFTPLCQSFGDFLRSLNWKINYNGLSDLKIAKKYFKSITITHGYNCNYSINSYTSFTSDNMVNSDFYSDLVDGNVYLAPKYDISAVSIDERFNPILGIDSKLQNNITTKLEIRNNRLVSMSLVNSEISETGGYEYVVGVGYVFKNFTVNIKTAGTNKAYTNDINTRMDLSLRDNTTIRRTISDDVKSVIQGQKIWSLKWFADYMLTQQLTIRAFFDWTINQPRTNGYMTSNKNFGLNLRFTLI